MGADDSLIPFSNADIELLYSASTKESTVKYTFAKDYKQIIAISNQYLQSMAIPNIGIVSSTAVSLLNTTKVGSASAGGAATSRLVVYKDIKQGNSISTLAYYGTFFVMGIS